jgi:hypothetical protein
MGKREHTQEYLDLHLKYSVKNILRHSFIMLVALSFSWLVTAPFSWLRLAVTIPAAILFGIATIAFQKYLYKRKGSQSLPPEPKYGDKTYADHQTDKHAAISKDA